MLLDFIGGLFSSDLAIDLGTANTLLIQKGKGLVLNEPSVVAIHNESKEIKAVGRDARKMLGRTPGSITALRPLKDGVIANFEICEVMIRYFIQQVHNRRSLVRPRVVIAVPSGITQVEKRAVRDASLSAGVREVVLIEEPMAAAIGVGLPISEASGNMIIDIGGGTTEVAIISLSGVVYSKSVRVAGDEIDEAIVNYVKRKYNLLIGSMTAENIKKTIGSAYPLDEPMVMEIKGRDLMQGIPKTLVINDAEVREALEEPLATIVHTVKVALEKTPPELAADIVDRGMVIAGGGSLLQGLDNLLRAETSLPIVKTDDPLKAVVMGVGKVLEDPELLRKIKIY
ncbi:MAG: rod shape-determining protein [Nitrospinota bacterium]